MSFENTKRLVLSKTGKLGTSVSETGAFVTVKIKQHLDAVQRQISKLNWSMAWAGISGKIRWAFANLWAGVKIITGYTLRTLKYVAGGIWGGLLKFIKSPAGLFTVGYLLGYAWARWIKPLWDSFWPKNLKPALQSIADWLHGKKSFTAALVDAFKHITEPLTTWWDGHVIPWIRETVFGKWFKQDIYKRNEKDEIQYQDVNGKKVPIYKEFSELLTGTAVDIADKFFNYEIGKTGFKVWEILAWVAGLKAIGPAVKFLGSIGSFVNAAIISGKLGA